MTSRIAAIFMLCAVALFTFALAACCGGCSPVVTPQGIAAAGGTATGQLQGAKADITAAMSHADQYGKGLLTSADTAIAHVLTTELPALEAAGPALEKVTKEAAADHAANKWVGWQVRNIWRWIVITLVSLSILQIAMFFFAGTSPVGIWKVGAAIIGRVIGFVNVGIGYIITLIHSHKVKTEAVKEAQSISGISLLNPQAK